MKLNANYQEETGRLPLLRGAIPIMVSLVCLWLLRDSIDHVDFTAVTHAAMTIPWHDWMIAAALTAISFAAVAQYDRLVAVWLGIDLPARLILFAGWRATAISQVLGYGLVTGSLTRWRALGRPGGLSLWRCCQLTLGVTISFFAGAAIVVSIAILLAPTASFAPWSRALGLCCIGAAACVLTLTIWPPARLYSSIPGPVFMVKTILFAAIDTLAAALIIYVFLPSGDTNFMLFYAAFLVALCAGMLSGLPAGIGAFEMTLVALLAPTDPGALLSAIFGFRVIYYAVPAIVAGASLIWVSERKGPFIALPVLSKLRDDLARYAPPEADLTTQNLLHLVALQSDSSAALRHHARNCDIVLGDPFGACAPDIILGCLKAEAGARLQPLVLYKCGASTVRAAAKHGFRSFQIGSEAVVNPSSFTIQGSERRQLRRKLRQAQKANVEVNQDMPPFATLVDIDAEWQAQNGGARGFSMGYLTHRLLLRQRVFTARIDGRPIAFATFLSGARGWTLDLIRTRKNCPDGTVHSLVAAGLEAAKCDAISRVSLAAAPFKLAVPPQNTFEKIVGRIFQRDASLRGLAQFKASFGPDWHPTYLTYSSLVALPLAVFDLWHLINRTHAAEMPKANHPHNDYHGYEFDSANPAWHALQRIPERGNKI